MWPFRQAKEVRATLAQLEIEAERYRDQSGTLSGIFDIFDTVKKQIVVDKAKVIHSIGQEGASPRAIVHLVISNTIHSQLWTGEYHVYRGKLNRIGSDKLKLFDFATDALAEEGFQTSEDAKEDKTEMRRLIAEAG